MARKGIKNIQATKTSVDGIEVASKFEAEYYTFSRLREEAGEIQDLKTHVAFPLRNETVKIRELRGDKVRTYTADFVFKENGKVVVVETKGRMEPVHSLRLSVFKALYPEIELRVVRQKKRKTRRKKDK